MNYKEICFSIEFKIPKKIPLLTNQKLVNIERKKIINPFKQKIRNKKIFQLNTIEKRKFTYKDFILSLELKMLKLIKIKSTNSAIQFKKKEINFKNNLRNNLIKIKKKKIKLIFNFDLAKKIKIKSQKNIEFSSESEIILINKNINLIINKRNIIGYERDFLLLKESFLVKEIIHEGDWLVILENKFVITKRKSSYPIQISKNNEYLIKNTNLIKKIEEIIKLRNL